METRDPEKYKKLFAQKNAGVVDAPYSALFDYDKLAQEELARKEQLQKSQQRIQKTNIIGDALRLLSEGVTGSMGASIIPRPVNPGIMQASQRINALEDRSQSNMDRLRLQDLAMKEKGLTYNLGRDAQREAKTWEDNKRAEQLRHASEEAEKGRIHQKEMNEADNVSREKITKMTANSGVEKAYITAQNKIDQISEKAKQDVKKAGGFYVPRYDNPRELEVLSVQTVTSQFPIIRTLLKAKNIYPGSINYPKVLEQQDKGNVNESDLIDIIHQFPDVYGKIYPQLYGPGYQQPQQPAFNSPLLNGMFQSRRVPYTPGQGPLRPTGMTAPAPVAPAVQQFNPAEVVKTILPDAQTIYSRAESADQVMNDLKALINTRFQDASPQEKATIYNDLIKQF